jgi:hypothetical protein
MRSSLALAAALLVATVFGLSARGSPPSVSPGSGGISQTVALTQFGFSPVKKPKVQLVPHAGTTGLKPVGLKVTTFSASEIDGQVTAGLAGTYDVVVRPTDKGASPVTLPDTFTIVLPAPAMTDPTTGPAGTVVTIHGSKFGDVKGKVTIGGKKAKVKSWGDDTIVVVVPKAAPGDQPVVVTNKAGSSDGSLKFDVTSSAPSGGGGKGDEYLRADLSGKGHFEANNGKPGFVVSWNDANSHLTFGGTSQPTKGYPDLDISIVPLDVTLPMPYHIGLSPNPPVNALATLSYTEATPAVKIHSASLGNPGSALDIVVTGWDGTFLEGTFTATLVEAGAGGSAPITVTNGAFRVRRATGH